MCRRSAVHAAPLHEVTTLHSMIKLQLRCSRSNKNENRQSASDNQFESRMFECFGVSSLFEKKVRMPQRIDTLGIDSVFVPSFYSPSPLQLQSLIELFYKQNLNLPYCIADASK